MMLDDFLFFGRIGPGMADKKFPESSIKYQKCSFFSG